MITYHSARLTVPGRKPEAREQPCSQCLAAVPKRKAASKRGGMIAGKRSFTSIAIAQEKILDLVPEHFTQSAWSKHYPEMLACLPRLQIECTAAVRQALCPCWVFEHVEREVMLVLQIAPNRLCRPRAFANCSIFSRFAALGPEWEDAEQISHHDTSSQVRASLSRGRVRRHEASPSEDAETAAKLSLTTG